MIKHLNTPNTNGDGNGKDSNYLPQIQQVSKSFFEKPKTSYQVAIDTGITRPNVCRYVGSLKKSDNIAVVRFGICPISKENGVQFLTTNPAFYPKERQLNLFEPDIDVISKKKGVNE